jgi:NADH:ubiquinone oxidoreductase subunit H
VLQYRRSVRRLWVGLGLVVAGVLIARPTVYLAAVGLFFGDHVAAPSAAAAGLLILWLQYAAVAVYTIWARGVGPRFRPDQVSDVTWRDFLVFLAAGLAAVLGLG